MTREEFGVLAAALKTMYDFFMTDEDEFNLWYTFLCDLDYKTASASVQKYICENTTKPKVADIRRLAAEIEHPIGDWSSGWEEVQKAIVKFGWPDQDGALAYMSEITRETVKRMGWMNICTSTNVSADRANFRTIYELIAERTAKEYALPQNMHKRISEIQSEKRLELKDGNM